MRAWSATTSGTETAEINLVSMIDMFTILVFFLLVHGGFVRLAILELNLPTSQSTADDKPPEFQLEITVRDSGIEVGDRSTGLLSQDREDRRRLSPRRARPPIFPASSSSSRRRPTRRYCSSPTSPTSCSWR